MPITIKEISALETYSVRHVVLRVGRPIEDCAMDGDDLETTFHLGAFEGDLHVGVATFLKSEPVDLPFSVASDASYYQLRGMGVVADQQGKGIGAKLLQEGIKKLKANSVDLLWFNARIKAVPFYERLGFEKYGSAFEVPLIGTHFKMYKQL
ncbi:Acetyltransferase (GNAT) domain-containing protein [Nonlabens sp. Hel1_33_55]|uniref:GNAT family N-acetyltransferase n=1 Tax=Nonlabens sp. Hel1_33_55 TaxID=1336802 RepID=UPI000875ACC6|nr:GNAT family N-acetyltransferase [Nonlabens sp. Hel1_33_55]SCY40440.1 Acetyltransferase (GNAT) domain-containing protein [Nonlabens sp. Hel1_33_55]